MPLTPPVATARTAPDMSGMFGNGFTTKITFAADPDIEFAEIEVTPGGDDVGDGIDATTMFNTGRKTKDAPALSETEDGSALVAYSAATRAQCRALLGVFTTITITYPDGSTEADYGWLRSFKPGSLVINGRPTATVAFTFACKDADGFESEPVVV